MGSPRQADDVIERRDVSSSTMRDILLTPLKDLQIDQHQHHQHHQRSGDAAVRDTSLHGNDGVGSVFVTSTSTPNRDIAFSSTVENNGRERPFWTDLGEGGLIQSTWMSPKEVPSWLENDKHPLHMQHEDVAQGPSALSLYCGGEDDGRDEEGCAVSANSSLLTTLAAASALQLHPPTGHLGEGIGHSLAGFHAFCQRTFIHRLTSPALNDAWLEHLESYGNTVVLPRSTLLVDAARDMKSRRTGAIAISPSDDRDASISGIHPNEVLLSSDFDLAIQMAQLMCCSNLEEVTVGDFLDVVQPMRGSGGGGEIGYGAEEDLDGWLKCDWEQLPACLIIRGGEEEDEVLVTPSVILAILSRAIVNDYENSSPAKDEQEEDNVLKVQQHVPGEEAIYTLSPVRSEQARRSTLPIPHIIVSESSPRRRHTVVIGEAPSPPKTPASPAPPLMLSIAGEVTMERTTQAITVQPHTMQQHARPSSDVTSSYPRSSNTSDGRDLLDLCWQMKNDRARRQRCRQQEALLNTLNKRIPSPPPVPPVQFTFGGEDGARQDPQHEELPLPLPGRVLDEAETTSSFRPDVPLALLDPHHPLFAAAVQRKLRAPATPAAYTAARSSSTLATSPRQSYYFNADPSPVHSSYSSAPTDISDAPKKARRYIAKVRALQRQHEKRVAKVGGGKEAEHTLLLAQYVSGEDDLIKRREAGGMEGGEGFLHDIKSPQRRASILNNIDDIAGVVFDDEEDDDDDDEGSITTDVMELIAGDVNFLPPPDTLLETETLGQKKHTSLRSRPPALLDLTPASKRQQSVTGSPLPHSDSPLPPPPSTTARPAKRWHTIIPLFFSSSRTASPIITPDHTVGGCIDTTTASTSTTVRIAPFFSMPFRRYKTTQAVC